MLGDVLIRATHATAQPRGVAVTPDGRYAVVAGGAQLTALPFAGYGAFCEQVTSVDSCGALWVIDLKTNSVIANVTGVGNEPYGVAVAQDADRDDHEDRSDRHDR